MQHEIIRQICAAIQSANYLLRIPTKIFLGPLATSHQRFVYFNIATQHPISHPLRLSSGESRGKEWFTLTLTSMNDVQSSISRKCMPLEYGWSCYTWKNPKHALGVYTPTPHPTFPRLWDISANMWCYLCNTCQTATMALNTKGERD